jgi:hypothetical protein
MTTKSLIDTQTEAKGATSSAYPMHEAWVKDPNGKKLDRTCAGFLILPETLGLAPDGTALFCLACARHVAPEPGQREQAERAAAAEGMKPIERGKLTPGALPDEARAALLYHHHLSVNSRTVGVSVVDMEKTVRNGWPALSALGLTADAHALNDAGRDMQRRIVSPEVPIDRLVTDPRFAPVHEAPKAKPTTRKEKPVAPMVCECGHGPARHTMRAARGFDPCNEPGCDCKRYRNVQPPKPEKPAKAKRKAAA